MESRTRSQLLTGRNQAPGDQVPVRAGHVAAIVDAPDLRRVRIGVVDIVQRVYVAVRDTAWNTIPGTLSDLQIDAEDDRFHMNFQVRHRYDDVDFQWTGTIEGDQDGTISYSMDGIALSEFEYNKIGFNLHHPLSQCIGQPYRAWTGDGEISGTLPELIDPQLIVNGTLSGMFAPFESLTISHSGGVEVRFDFEGDLFEMQDHRNWTDANYKTYGTPLAVPYPMKAVAGQRLYQKVTIRVLREPESIVEPRAEVALRVRGEHGGTMPAIGLGMPSDAGALSQREKRLLRALNLDHVRVDLHPLQPDWIDVLDNAVNSAREIGAGLEIALFLPPDATRALELATPHLQEVDVPIRQILVLEEAEGFSTFRLMTSSTLLEMVKDRWRDRLPGVPVVGGTDQFFTELNRDWTNVDAGDAIAFSLNPQVHACDDTSLMENLRGQAEVVHSTRHYAGKTPICISPITFIGRSGPFPAGPPAPSGLPPTVDVRQPSLFGAAWTVGSLATLAREQVESITYFETVGWRGVIERDDMTHSLDLFPSRDGDVFPMYHVFADVGDWKGGKTIDVESSDDQRVVAICIARGGDLHLLLSNLTPYHQSVVLGGLEKPAASVRVLDETTAFTAMTDVDSFRAQSEEKPVTGGRIRLELLPYATVRVDADCDSGST